MIKLTCLLKRKEGMTPAEFQEYWKNSHGPLIARSQCGSHVIRYEQNPRPLSDYRGDDDRSDEASRSSSSGGAMPGAFNRIGAPAGA